MALYLGSNKVSINKYIQESGGDGGDSTTGSSDDVKFIDYDGTILYSYSTSDFLALTELPANPTHTGLVPQGWNWSLADAKTHVSDYGKLIIGQLYTTESGKTEIDIYLSPDSIRLDPCLCLSVNGEVDIDWGDNTTHDILTGKNIYAAIDTTHEYASPGNYTILISVINGEASFYSSGSSAPFFKKGNNDAYANSYIYSNAVQAIRIGNNFKIRTYVFNHCYSLSSITFPSNAINGNTIVNYTFQHCYSLLSITLPNGVTSIGAYAFQYCYSLSSISIPNTITTIGNYAFGYCYSLLSMTLPNGVTSIGSNTFISCYSLSSINIPGTITTIISSFSSCRSLTSVNIANGVTSIGTDAFSNCSSLSSVNLPDGITSIGNNAFRECHSLSSINIPSTVTTIATYVFYNCYSLLSITIPSTVTSIGNYTFYNCYSLFSVNIPNGITTIAAYTFYNCYSLSSITIPSTVTTIATQAFYNCYGMKEYHLLPTTPPTLGSTNAFTNIPSDCIIYVPQGTLEAYQTATNWSTYASYMQE